MKKVISIICLFNFVTMVAGAESNESLCRDSARTAIDFIFNTTGKGAAALANDSSYEKIASSVNLAKSQIQSEIDSLSRTARANDADLSKAITMMRIQNGDYLALLSAYSNMMNYGYLTPESLKRVSDLKDKVNQMEEKRTADGLMELGIGKMSFSGGSEAIRNAKDIVNLVATKESNEVRSLNLARTAYLSKVKEREDRFKKVPPLETICDGIYADDSGNYVFVEPSQKASLPANRAGRNSVPVTPRAANQGAAQ